MTYHTHPRMTLQFLTPCKIYSPLKWRWFCTAAQWWLKVVALLHTERSNRIATLMFIWIRLQNLVKRKNDGLIPFQPSLYRRRAYRSTFWLTILLKRWSIWRALKFPSPNCNIVPRRNLCLTSLNRNLKLKFNDFSRQNQYGNVKNIDLDCVEVVQL